MASTFRIRAKLLVRVVAPILFAAVLSACSAVPDWVDPTTWFGGDSQASSDQSSDAGAGTDQTAGAGAEQSTATGKEAASAQSAPSDQTPDIAAIPPRPAAPSTADEQKQVADSLAADRAQAHYSADALRGGTEAAAAPPPAEGAASAISPSSAADTGAGAASSTADNQTASNPPASPADATAPSAGAGGGAEGPSAATSEAQAAPIAPSASPASGSAPAPNEVASTDSARNAALASAPMAATTGVPSAQGAPDMQATFAPSKAPALDPSVGQFVPQQILSRYHETAAAAAVPVSEFGTGARAKRHKKKMKTSQTVIRPPYASRGGAGHLAMMPARYLSREDNGPLGRAAPTLSSYGLGPRLFASTDRTALSIVSFESKTTILGRMAQNRT